MKSVYLCGFMGCGKTYTGKLLAKDLGVSFTDLDECICRKEGRSIPKIFEENGEPYFRRLESECIRELSGGGVVATGGGALLDASNAKYANENGYVVFLDASFPVCYARIKDDKNRPLVMKNTKEQLKELFDKRREIYLANSSIKVSADDNAKTVLKAIAEKIGGDLKGNV